MKNSEQRRKEAIERAESRWDHYKHEWKDEENKTRSWKDQYKGGKEAYLNLFRAKRDRVEVKVGNAQMIDEERNTTTCWCCGLNFPDSDMVPREQGEGELCPKCVTSPGSGS